MKNDDDWITFLLAEHSYFADSFWKSEEVGESRITILTGLVTGFLAALVALGSFPGIVLSTFYMFSIGSLLFLLMIGTLVFLRMVHRAKKTDEWKARLDHVRDFFLKGEEMKKSDYKPFDDDVLLGYMKKFQSGRSLKRGGLTATAIVVNSSLAATIGLFFMLFLGYLNYIFIIIGVLVFGSVASALQLIFVSKSKR